MDIKQVQISESAMKKGGKRSRKKKQQQVEEEPSNKQKKARILQVTKEGGGCGVPGYQAPIQVSSASPLAEAFLKPVSQATLDQPIPVAGAPMPFGGQGQASMQLGGKTIQLHKKAEGAKVKLHSKKVEVKKHLTKKNRKIILGLVGLKKRQTKASKIKQSVKEMPLEDLKKHLIAKGLIKVGSKAPESILRQIAADSQIVGSGSC